MVCRVNTSKYYRWQALLKTIGLCLFSILIEALSAKKKRELWFEQLKRSKYSFSLQAWYFTGQFTILFSESLLTVNFQLI